MPGVTTVGGSLAAGLVEGTTGVAMVCRSSSSSLPKTGSKMPDMMICVYGRVGRVKNNVLMRCDQRGSTMGLLGAIGRQRL